MCFVPQRRARFERLNFQKCSDTEVLFNIVTSKFASCHSGMQLFISHLPRWLRTRLFSEPTFRPSGAKTLSRTLIFVLLIFFLLTLSLLTLSLLGLLLPLLLHLSISR